MRCLIVTTTASPDTGTPANVQQLRSTLKAFGIGHRRATVEALPTIASIVAAYDFIVIPSINLNTYATALINQAALTIPIFVLAMDTSYTNLGTTPGVNGTASAVGDQFFISPMTTSAYAAINAKWWTLNGGVSLITSAALDALSGSAQTYAGQTCAWQTTKAGSGNLYVATLDAGASGSAIPLFLQTAVNNGEISATALAGMRKAPVTVDMDHITGDYFYQSRSQMGRFIDRIPATARVWCGAYNYADTNITAMSADVNAELKTDTRLRYCYHTHNPARLYPTSGAWPYANQGGSLADTKTKINQDTYYAYDKALWEGKGLTYSTSEGAYYNPGNNAWNEETLQLFSRDSCCASSIGNDVSKPGYGYIMARQTFGGASSRVSKSELVNAHTYRRMVRGITLIPSWDMGPLNGNTTIALWRTAFKYQMLAINIGLSMYLHDEDFQDPQGGNTANNGGEVLGQILDHAAFFKDICHYFADPTENALRRNLVL